MSESFRDLIVWQKAMALVTDIYRATELFPKRERYGLVDQLCRAAVAIPSDVAEGKGRLSKKKLVQMLPRTRRGFTPPERFDPQRAGSSRARRLS